MARLSALRTDRLHPPGNIPGTQLCYRLSRRHCPSATGKIMSMKTSNDTIANRTRDLPACCAVPQRYEPLRAPNKSYTAPGSFNSNCTITFMREATSTLIYTKLKKKKKINRHEPTCSGIIHINYCQPKNFSQ